MEEDKEIIQKCINIIKDRLNGVQNDLKAFLYIRKENLQHKHDNIGGGNIVVALSLFTCLGFLGKAYYCTEKPNNFDPDGSANETEVFIHFMKFIQRSGIDLGLPTKGDILELVWDGFRNQLAHCLNVDPGKSIVTFQFEPENKNTINQILLEAKKNKVFEHNGEFRNWVVNCDVLFAYLPDIVNQTIEHISQKKDINADLLRKVVNIEYP